MTKCLKLLTRNKKEIEEIFAITPTLRGKYFDQTHSSMDLIQRATQRKVSESIFITEFAAEKDTIGPRIYIILGEPGSGKSEFCEKLSRSLDERLFHVVHIRSDELNPYIMYSRLIENAIKTLPEESIEDLEITSFQEKRANVEKRFQGEEREAYARSIAWRSLGDSYSKGTLDRPKNKTIEREFVEDIAGRLLEKITAWMLQPTPEKLEDQKQEFADPDYVKEKLRELNWEGRESSREISRTINDAILRGLLRETEVSPEIVGSLVRQLADNLNQKAGKRLVLVIDDLSAVQIVSKYVFNLVERFEGNFDAILGFTPGVLTEIEEKYGIGREDRTSSVSDRIGDRIYTTTKDNIPVMFLDKPGNCVRLAAKYLKLLKDKPNFDKKCLEFTSLELFPFNHHFIKRIFEALELGKKTQRHLLIAIKKLVEGSISDLRAPCFHIDKISGMLSPDSGLPIDGSERSLYPDLAVLAEWYGEKHDGKLFLEVKALQAFDFKLSSVPPKLVSEDKKWVMFHLYSAFAPGLQELLQKEKVERKIDAKQITSELASINVTLSKWGKGEKLSPAQVENNITYLKKGYEKLLKHIDFRTRPLTVLGKIHNEKYFMKRRGAVPLVVENLDSGETIGVTIERILDNAGVAHKIAQIGYLDSIGHLDTSSIEEIFTTLGVGYFEEQIDAFNKDIKSQLNEELRDATIEDMVLAMARLLFVFANPKYIGESNCQTEFLNFLKEQTKSELKWIPEDLEELKSSIGHTEEEKGIFGFSKQICDLCREAFMLRESVLDFGKFSSSWDKISERDLLDLFKYGYRPEREIVVSDGKAELPFVTIFDRFSLLTKSLYSRKFRKAKEALIDEKKSEVELFQGIIDEITDEQEVVELVERLHFLGEVIPEASMKALIKEAYDMVRDDEKKLGHTEARKFSEKIVSLDTGETFQFFDFLYTIHRLKSNTFYQVVQRLRKITEKEVPRAKTISQTYASYISKEFHRLLETGGIETRGD